LACRIASEVCGTDSHCRPSCQTTTDCLAKQECVSNAGAMACYDTTISIDLTVIAAAADAGAEAEAATPEPGMDAPMGDDAATDGDATMANAPDVMATNSADAGGDATVDVADAPGDSADVGSDSAEAEAAVVSCSQVCGPATQCMDGVCAPCGALNTPCCGTMCGSANLTCSPAGICSCGDQGQACCGGTTCNSGNLKCVSPDAGASASNPICECGKAGEPPCPAPGDAGDGGTCTPPLVFAGLACGCQVACKSAFVLRSDGTYWNTSAVVTDPSRAGVYRDLSTAPAGRGAYLSCSVATDGTVWCNGRDNTYGQLGNPATPGNYAAAGQVLTAQGGPALSNINRVFASGSAQDACAIDTNGAVWCWGRGDQGQLGTGNTFNSAVAAPALTQSGGPQLSGVAELGMGTGFVCARKTEGSVWCWGDNSSGQIGVGSTVVQTYLYPVQVQSLFKSVVSLTASNTYACARTGDNTVWCWGQSPVGGSISSPAQVMTSAEGGGPFLALQVEAGFTGQPTSVCALRAPDRSVWCWTGPGPVYPAPYTEANFLVSGVFALCSDPQYAQPSFVDNKGLLHDEGNLLDKQVPCP